jgi:hypothetical protein
VLQRQTALAAIKRVRVPRGPHAAALKQFTDWVATGTDVSWAEAAARARRDVPDQIDTLALALWGTGDVVVRANVMRALDPARPDELATLEKLIARARGEADAEPLRAALERRHPAVIARVARKRAVPVALHAEVVALRRLPDR